MLRVRDLWVEVEGRSVLKGINLDVGEGEIVALLGPNGSGKSSLMHTLMGHPRYKVVRGKIEFMNVDITHLPPDERAKLGMGMAMQIPPRLKGIKLKDLIREISKRYGNSYEYVVELARKIGADHLMGRDLHDGFSGGEMKKAEILLLAAQRPRFSLLDEPDSGVDLQTLPILGNAISDVLSEMDDKAYERGAGIVVTHTGQILKYLKSVNRGYIIIDGEIKCFGDPYAILKDVERFGFNNCVNCISVVR